LIILQVLWVHACQVLLSELTEEALDQLAQE
jgi:hypothetical protein